MPVEAPNGSITNPYVPVDGNETSKVFPLGPEVPKPIQVVVVVPR